MWFYSLVGESRNPITKICPHSWPLLDCYGDLRTLSRQEILSQVWNQSVEFMAINKDFEDFFLQGGHLSLVANRRLLRPPLVDQLCLSGQSLPQIALGLQHFFFLQANLYGGRQPQCWMLHQDIHGVVTTTEDFWSSFIEHQAFLRVLPLPPFTGDHDPDMIWRAALAQAVFEKPPLDELVVWPHLERFLMEYPDLDWTNPKHTMIVAGLTEAFARLFLILSQA
jgi:hypothetical protein